MINSEKIDKIAMALVGIQGDIKPAIKDAKNPHLRNTYASLSAVWEAVQPALQKHGCAVIQPAEDVGDGSISITTIVLHGESGQYIGGTLRLPITPQKGVNPAQVAGSGISYARRYSLASLLGVMQEDDDGHAASVPPRQQQQPPTPPPAPVVISDKEYIQKCRHGLENSLFVPSDNVDDELEKLRRTHNGNAKDMYARCLSLYKDGAAWNDEAKEIRSFV